MPMCEKCVYFVSYGNLFDNGYCIKYLEEKEKTFKCAEITERDEHENEVKDKLLNTFLGGSYE